MATEQQDTAEEQKLDSLVEQIRETARKHLKAGAKKKQDPKHAAAHPLGRMTDRTGNMHSAEKATEAIVLNALEAALMSLGLLKLLLGKGEPAEPDAESLEIVDGESRGEDENLAIDDGAIDVDARNPEETLQLDSGRKALRGGDDAEPSLSPLGAQETTVLALPETGTARAAAGGRSAPAPGAAGGGGAAAGAGGAAGAGAGAAGIIAGIVEKVSEAVGEVATAVGTEVDNAEAQAGQPPPFPLPERTGPQNVETASRGAGRR